MSKLADALRACRVSNNWDMLCEFGDGDLCVEYATGDTWRVPKTTVWAVRPRAGLEPQPLAGKTWHKTFVGRRSATLPQAREWVETNVGRKLVPSPFGGYLTEPVVVKAKAFVERRGGV